jgi:hypothetical protein
MAARHPEQRHGPRSYEQQQRIINRQEQTKAANIEPVNESIDEAQQKHPRPQEAYDNETGNRSIEHGANQESEHRKRRSH